MTPPQAVPERQFCTFYLDGRMFGVEVLEVQEILRWQELTAVPLAPDVVVGLMNLRGQIVPVLDLRRRLQLPERDPEARPLNVLVRNAGGVVSMLVDRVGDVLSVPDDHFEPPPHTLQGLGRELIRGAYKLDHGLLLALATEKVLQIGESA